MIALPRGSHYRSSESGPSRRRMLRFSHQARQSRASSRPPGGSRAGASPWQGAHATPGGVAAVLAVRTLGRGCRLVGLARLEGAEGSGRYRAADQEAALGVAEQAWRLGRLPHVRAGDQIAGGGRLSPSAYPWGHRPERG